jgi:hypothetical protein
VKYIRKKCIIICFPLFICLTLWALFSGLKLHRPMFYPEFGWNEFKALPRWRSPIVDWVDKRGDFALQDIPLNLLLVVMNASHESGSDINEGFQKAKPIIHSIWSSASRSQVLVLIDDRKVVIPRCSNQIIIILPDGNTLRGQLHYQQARTMPERSVEDYEDDILAGIEKHLIQDESEAHRVLQEARKLMEKDRMKGQKPL